MKYEYLIFDIANKSADYVNTISNDDIRKRLNGEYIIIRLPAGTNISSLECDKEPEWWHMAIQ